MCVACHFWLYRVEEQRVVQTYTTTDCRLKKKKNEREAIKCSSVIRSLDIVRQVMMVVLFTLRQRHRHRQRLLQHTCRLLTVLFFLHRLLHRPPLLRGISSIFWPDSVPHKSSLGERLLIQVSPHGYWHSKESHTSVQDLVVHVRVRWIVETLPRLPSHTPGAY